MERARDRYHGTWTCEDKVPDLNVRVIVLAQTYHKLSGASLYRLADYLICLWRAMDEPCMHACVGWW